MPPKRGAAAVGRGAAKAAPAATRPKVRDKDRLYLVVDPAANDYIGVMVDAVFDMTVAEASLGSSASESALVAASSPPPSQQQVASQDDSAAGGGCQGSHRIIRNVESLLEASVRLITHSVPRRDRAAAAGSKQPRSSEPCVQRSVVTYVFVELDVAKSVLQSDQIPEMVRAFVAAATEESAQLFTPPPSSVDSQGGGGSPTMVPMPPLFSAITSNDDTAATTVDFSSTGAGPLPPVVVLPDSVPPPRIHFALVNFNGTSRAAGGPRSATEATIGAELVLASPCVAGVNFVGTHGDVTAMLKPSIEYALRSMTGKGSDELDAAAITEPQSKGPKIATDWEMGYLRMLCEIPSISETRARCIVGVFPTMSSLLMELKEQPPLPEPPAPVTEKHLTARFAALSRQSEGNTNVRSGADREGRRFGVGLTVGLIRSLMTPFDPTAVTGTGN